jgi:hypothetical protein
MSLSHGATEDRDFNVLSDYAGTLKIQGYWNPSQIGFSTAHMRLRVLRVIRPDGSEISAEDLEGVVLGFPQNSGAHSSQKLSVIVNVREQDVGGTIPNDNNKWTVVITSPEAPDVVTGILLSFKFTPRLCP